MCGILGYVNRDLPKEFIPEFVKQGLITNSLRGVDGAGFAFINPAGEVSLYKRALPGWDLFQLAPMARMIRESAESVFGLVHNRAATNGGIKIDTTHPVTSGDITLVHNGVVNSVHALCGNYQEHDSTAIAISLNEKGEKETLEMLTGSYALMWYNNKDKSLNIARNEARPLNIVTLKGSKSLIFSSESGLALWLLERLNVSAKAISAVEPLNHIKVPLSGDSKQRIQKYAHKAPAYSAVHTPGKYTPVVAGQEFYAVYLGDYSGSSYRGKCAKFRHVKDPQYAWLVKWQDDMDKKLLHGAMYKLKAVETRSTEHVVADLEAELDSYVVYELRTPEKKKSVYRTDQRVTFVVDSLESRKGRTLSMIGFVDDDYMTEVRSFNVALGSNITVGKTYSGIVQSVVLDIKSQKDFLLLRPKSIAPVNPTLPNTPLLPHTVHKCEWCEIQLTDREFNNNRPEHLVADGSALCDTCLRQYAAMSGDRDV